MKKNGFTLIELLAVIVILAIIALIATPIILGIINDAREESDERSVELYASAIKNAMAAYQLTHTNAPTSIEDLDIEYEGEVVCKTQELYADGRIYLDGCEVNGSEKEYSYGKEVGYTGTIYRNSTEALSIGNYINTNNRWCLVVPGVANTCFDNEYSIIAFNSKTECETALEQLANSGELDETMQYLVANAICEQGTLTYETSPTNINKSYYLKHDVVDNKVTASYACITYTENGIRKDVCVRGVDPLYYESNQTIFHSIESYFNTLSSQYSGSGSSGNGTCGFSDSESGCNSDSLSLDADSYGYVSSYGPVLVNDDGTWGGRSHCNVSSDGNSYCGE